MTVTSSTLYWITRCDGFVAFGVIFFVLFAAAIIFLTNHIIFYESEMCAKFAWFASAIGLILSASIALFVPTTKEMAAIIVIPKIANSETVKELGDGVVALAQEWIEELKPNKEGETK